IGLSAVKIREPIDSAQQHTDLWIFFKNLYWEEVFSLTPSPGGSSKTGSARWAPFVFLPGGGWGCRPSASPGIGRKRARLAHRSCYAICIAFRGVVNAASADASAAVHFCHFALPD